MRRIMTDKPLPRKYREIRRQLRVKRSSAGLGLFTEEPIEAGGFVVEYTGAVLSVAEIQGSRSRYLFQTNPRRFVDGRDRSNLARYINHSCAPNCEVLIRRGRIYVFARRRIRAGEELGYDYRAEYFDAYIKPIGCRCVKCRTCAR